MLHVMEENGLVRVRASGTLDSSDYDRFVPFDPTEIRSAEAWARACKENGET